MPDPTPDTIHRIPTTQIDDDALIRDRSGLDETALTELRLSIASSGLRMPVELWPLSDTQTASDPRYRYGLLSGLRRLHAFRALHELTGDDRYANIPAFLRTPGTMAQALTSMVEENEIRASVSPWERGRIALLAREQGVFDTIEQAVAKLYPAANRRKRTRLRALAHLAEELDGHLTAPETLTQRQALRLAAALDAGFGEVIRTALEESRADNPQTQWQLLLPILTEAETPQPETPTPRPGWALRAHLTRRPPPMSTHLIFEYITKSIS